MSLNDMQKRVSDFVIKNELETPVETRMLDLVSEVGELSKEILKSTSYGKEKFLSTKGWEEELGDVLFSIICIANTSNVNLEESLDYVLTKYNKRFDEKGDIGSGR